MSKPTKLHQSEPTTTSKQQQAGLQNVNTHPGQHALTSTELQLEAHFTFPFVVQTEAGQRSLIAKELESEDASKTEGSPSQHQLQQPATSPAGPDEAAIHPATANVGLSARNHTESSGMTWSGAGTYADKVSGKCQGNSTTSTDRLEYQHAVGPGIQTETSIHPAHSLNEAALGAAVGSKTVGLSATAPTSSRQLRPHSHKERQPFNPLNFTTWFRNRSMSPDREGLINLNTQLIKQLRQLKGVEEELKEVKTDAQDNYNRVAETKKELRQATAQRLAAEKRADKAQSAADTVYHQAEQLKQHLNAAQKQSTQMKATLKEAQAAAACVPALKQDLEVTSERLSQEQSQVDELEREVRLLKAQVASGSPAAAAHLSNKSLTSSEMGIGSVEQRSVLGRFSVAAAHMASHIIEVDRHGLLPIAASQAMQANWQACGLACGGAMQSVSETAAHDWLLREALACARGIHFTSISTTQNQLEIFAALAGPEGTQRLQEPLQQLHAQLHRSYFLAACRLSEGSGSMINDTMMQHVDFMAGSVGVQLGQRLHLDFALGNQLYKTLKHLMLAALQAAWLERSLPGCLVVLGEAGAVLDCDESVEPPVCLVAVAVPASKACTGLRALFCSQPGFEFTCPSSGERQVLVKRQVVAAVAVPAVAVESPEGQCRSTPSTALPPVPQTKEPEGPVLKLDDKQLTGIDQTQISKEEHNKRAEDSQADQPVQTVLATEEGHIDQPAAPDQSARGRTQDKDWCMIQGKEAAAASQEMEIDS